MQLAKVLHLVSVAINFMNELPKRKNIRIKNYDYSAPGAYFITICSAKREKYLGLIVGDNKAI